MRYLPLVFFTLALGAGCTADAPSPPAQVMQADDADRHVEVSDVQVEGEGSVIVTSVVDDKVEVAAEEVVDVVLQMDMTSKNFSFSPRTISARPGQDIAISFTNTGTHTFAIDEIGLNADVSNGGTVRFVAPTAPGNYRFYCSMGSHATLGMEGVLTIK